MNNFAHKASGSRFNATKRQLSARVVDAQMSDNHFTAAEKAELLGLSTELSLESDEIMVDAMAVGNSGGTRLDTVFRQMIEIQGRTTLKALKDQDPFMEDQEDEHLNEQERKEAEEEYLKEIAGYTPLVAPLPLSVSVSVSVPLVSSSSLLTVEPTSIAVPPPVIPVTLPLSTSTTADSDSSSESVVPLSATTAAAIA
eukprot:gene14652-31171_t